MPFAQPTPLWSLLDAFVRDIEEVEGPSWCLLVSLHLCGGVFLMPL